MKVVEDSVPRARRVPSALKSIYRRRSHPLLTAYRLYLKSAWVYIQNFVLNLFVYPLHLGITIMLWAAITRSNAAIPLSLPQLTAYYAIVLRLSRLMPFGIVSKQVAETIYQGQIAIYLARPMRLWWLPLAQCMAEASIGALVICPIMLLSVIVLRVPLDHLGLALVLYLVGCYVQFRFFFLIGALAFWIEQIPGVLYGVSLTLGLITGALLPLDMFPAWLYRGLMLTPFPYFLYYPTRLLVSPSAQIERSALGVLLLWCVLMTVLTLWVVRRGLRRFTGHGM